MNWKLQIYAIFISCLVTFCLPILGWFLHAGWSALNQLSDETLKKTMTDGKIWLAFIIFLMGCFGLISALTGLILTTGYTE